MTDEQSREEIEVAVSWAENGVFSTNEIGNSNLMMILAAAYRSDQVRIASLEAELAEVKKNKFVELTGTEIPVNELKVALDFEDFNSKEQMMCGWQRVHRELHIVAVAYRKAEKELVDALIQIDVSENIVRDLKAGPGK